MPNLGILPRSHRIWLDSNPIPEDASSVIMPLDNLTCKTYGTGWGQRIKRGRFSVQGVKRDEYQKKREILDAITIDPESVHFELIIEHKPTKHVVMNVNDNNGGVRQSNQMRSDLNQNSRRDRRVLTRAHHKKRKRNPGRLAATQSRIFVCGAN